MPWIVRKLERRGDAWKETFFWVCDSYHEARHQARQVQPNKNVAVNLEPLPPGAKLEVKGG